MLDPRVGINPDVRRVSRKALAQEGASRAAYALKLLQSEGELTIASTGKDPATGNLVTQDYRVEGPVMIFLTTTAIEIDEELLNRCLVLTVDEGRAQTEAIHARQRSKRTLAGLLAREDKTHLTRLHQNAQTLIRSLAVVNPYAERLTFLSDKTRTRRDHEKYLTLIDAIALLHQHQRPIQTTTHRGQPIEYVEVTLADIEIANAIAHEVLGRSLDELPPQTRRLLAAIVEHVNARCRAQSISRREYRFSRKTLREASGWGDTQLKVHLTRLVELEYLLVHRAQRAQGFVYELVFDGAVSEAVHLSGLIDPQQLQARAYDGKRSGQFGKRSGANADRSESGRPAVGGWSGPGRGADSELSTEPQSDIDESSEEVAKTHSSSGNGLHRSYPQPASPLAALSVGK